MISISAKRTDDLQFPTGWFGCRNGFKELSKEQVAESTVVLIGCGPVGLCSLVNIVDYKPKHILYVLLSLSEVNPVACSYADGIARAVDSIPSRLDLAKSLGAEPWNFQSDREGLNKRVLELTEGRGADVVIEVVGLSPALRMGYELLRPWGVISSIGVHNAEVSSMIEQTSFALIKARSPGRAMKRTIRISEFRWDAVR